MSTYRKIYYHIVFSTKYRTSCLFKTNRLKVYKYIWGVVKNQKCELHKINGVEDHIHLLISLHPSVALSNLIKDIKISSNHFISRHKLFPGFKGWQVGYSAFTFSENEKKRLMNYVENQEEHHKESSFRSELIGLLQEQDIDYKEEYLP